MLLHRKGRLEGALILEHPQRAGCCSEYPSQSSNSGERLYHDLHSIDGETAASCPDSYSTLKEPEGVSFSLQLLESSKGRGQRALQLAVLRHHL